jgi:hypothetical protein
VEEDLNQPDPEADEETETEQPEGDDRGLTILLLVVAILAVLALIGWVAVQRFDIPNPFAPAPAPTATIEPSPTAIPPPAARATATPTRVVADAEPSATPQPTATDVGLVEEVILEPVIGERVRNGSFEDGFENQIVGQGWTSFNNGAAVFEFLEETWPPAVFDGERAQRIQVREASQPDRYAGIYQTMRVEPGETYNLTLNGQIRSGEGDIEASQYGYRMQLGIDEGGGQDWTAVEDWVELPWDEQRFDSDSLFFYDYSTPIVATGSQLTIFVRSWNKWPDPGRVEYTVDAISLTGPIPSEEIAIDKPLPVTGTPLLSVSGWVRLMASAVVLCLLVAGAIWQVRRQIG